MILKYCNISIALLEWCLKHGWILAFKERKEKNLAKKNMFT